MPRSQRLCVANGDIIDLAKSRLRDRVAADCRERGERIWRLAGSGDVSLKRLNLRSARSSERITQQSKGIAESLKSAIRENLVFRQAQEARTQG